MLREAVGCFVLFYSFYQTAYFLLGKTKQSHGVGEMAQQIKALTAFEEDLGFIPRTHIELTSICDPSFRISGALF